VKAPGVRTAISLSVKSGEIVGLFGLVGAGRSELMKGLFGGTRITDGHVMLDGERVDIRTPAHAIRAGMMLCPEDRKADGIIPVHSVRDNINISARRKHIHVGCLINNAWEENIAAHHIQSLNIKTPGAEQLIMNLSGGNQQKAILGRWLSEEMKVILLDEPTRGIDVGAKHEIYNVIYALAASGVAVLFASSDLPEVLGVADRIIVMREGEIAGELMHESANEQQALSLAMPKTTQAVA
jgi:L-arabinose transport system ATP-binding protein